MDIAYINGMILTHMNGENKKERQMRSFFYVLYGDGNDQSQFRDVLYSFLK